MVANIILLTCGFVITWHMDTISPPFFHMNRWHVSSSLEDMWLHLILPHGHLLAWQLATYLLPCWHVILDLSFCRILFPTSEFARWAHLNNTYKFYATNNFAQKLDFHLIPVVHQDWSISLVTQWSLQIPLHVSCAEWPSIVDPLSIWWSRFNYEPTPWG